MPDITHLIDLLKELEDDLTICMRCGMCQSVCPLYAQTGRESDVARGKLALLDGLSKQLFHDPEGAAERLNKCLLCGSCAANCPSGVTALDIFIKARSLLSGFMGLSPIKKIIFKGMLSHPELFNHLIKNASRFQGIFSKPANETLGTSCARFFPSLIKDRHFHRLADKPFHRDARQLTIPAGKTGITAAFFTGCIIDKVYPNIAHAVISSLKHHEFGIWIPENQACCGIPALSSGDADTFRKLVKHNLEGFDPNRFDVLVTACATCTSTIKKLWPLMIRGEKESIVKKVQAVSEKTMDICEFLYARVEEIYPEMEEQNDGDIITYHDPCHLKKSLGVTTQPRAFLKGNPNLRFVEMPESDWCCGMGGSFNLQYYETSLEIGKRKRLNIVSTGCSTIATGCPACMLQISDILSRSGDRIAVLHPMEIYADYLKSRGHATV